MFDWLKYGLFKWNMADWMKDGLLNEICLIEWNMADEWNMANWSKYG